MKNRFFLAALTLSLSCFAFAEPVSEPHAAFLKENQSSALEGVLAEANARLNLTDEQAEQVAPILHSNFEAQRAVFLDYGFDIERGTRPAKKLGFKQLRAMGRELEAVRVGTKDALKDVLNQEQMREFVSMQNERKNEVRQRIRAAR